MDILRLNFPVGSIYQVRLELDHMVKSNTGREVYFERYI